MPELTYETIRQYLTALEGRPVQVLGLAPLGQEHGEKAIKFCGYGSPIRVDYEAEGE